MIDESLNWFLQFNAFSSGLTKRNQAENELWFAQNRN